MERLKLIIFLELVKKNTIITLLFYIIKKMLLENVLKFLFIASLPCSLIAQDAQRIFRHDPYTSGFSGNLRQFAMLRTQMQESNEELMRERSLNLRKLKKDLKSIIINFTSIKHRAILSKQSQSIQTLFAHFYQALKSIQEIKTEVVQISYKDEIAALQEDFKKSVVTLQTLKRDLDSTTNDLESKKQSDSAILIKQLQAFNNLSAKFNQTLKSIDELKAEVGSNKKTLIELQKAQKSRPQDDPKLKEALEEIHSLKERITQINHKKEIIALQKDVQKYQEEIAALREKNTLYEARFEKIESVLNSKIAELTKKVQLQDRELESLKKENDTLKKQKKEDLMQVPQSAVVEDENPVQASLEREEPDCVAAAAAAMPEEVSLADPLPVTTIEEIARKINSGAPILTEDYELLEKIFFADLISYCVHFDTYSIEENEKPRDNIKTLCSLGGKKFDFQFFDILVRVYSSKKSQPIKEELFFFMTVFMDEFCQVLDMPPADLNKNTVLIYIGNFINALGSNMDKHCRFARFLNLGKAMYFQTRLRNIFHYFQENSKVERDSDFYKFEYLTKLFFVQHYFLSCALYGGQEILERYCNIDEFKKCITEEKCTNLIFTFLKNAYELKDCYLPLIKVVYSYYDYFFRSARKVSRLESYFNTYIIAFFYDDSIPVQRKEWFFKNIVEPEDGHKNGFDDFKRTMSGLCQKKKR
ncbi:MAG: hypothetical protein CNLJKLNK_00828 [Holosporales bacterium]